MDRRGLVKRVVLVLVGGVVLAGTMGQGCIITFPARTVDVELTDLTTTQVQAWQMYSTEEPYFSNRAMIVRQAFFICASSPSGIVPVS